MTHEKSLTGVWESASHVNVNTQEIGARVRQENSSDRLEGDSCNQIYPGKFIKLSVYELIERRLSTLEHRIVLKLYTYCSIIRRSGFPVYFVPYSALRSTPCIILMPTHQYTRTRAPLATANQRTEEVWFNFIFSWGKKISTENFPALLLLRLIGSACCCAILILCVWVWVEVKIFLQERDGCINPEKPLPFSFSRKDICHYSPLLFSSLTLALPMIV